MAMTAWSAKVFEQLDLLVGEGPRPSARSHDDDADGHALAQQRYRQDRSG